MASLAASPFEPERLDPNAYRALSSDPGFSRAEVPTPGSGSAEVSHACAFVDGRAGELARQRRSASLLAGNNLARGAVARAHGSSLSSYPAGSPRTLRFSRGCLYRATDAQQASALVDAPTGPRLPHHCRVPERHPEAFKSSLSPRDGSRMSNPSVRSSTSGVLQTARQEGR